MKLKKGVEVDLEKDVTISLIGNEEMADSFDLDFTDEDLFKSRYGNNVNQVSIILEHYPKGFVSSIENAYPDEYSRTRLQDGLDVYGIYAKGQFVSDTDFFVVEDLVSSDEHGGEDIPTKPTYYTITFDPNGGNSAIYQYVRKAGSEIGALPGARRISSNFTGWTSRRDGGSFAKPQMIVDGDMTLYAQYAYIVKTEQRLKSCFPYNGNGEAHDCMFQTRAIKINSSVKTAYRVVLRGRFICDDDKYAGLYVLGSLDGEHWQLIGAKEKRLSADGFHDLGCETYRVSMRYMMVAFVGKLGDGSHIDGLEITARDKYNNKLK